MLYSSTQNNKIKDIKKLQIKKERDLTKMFLVEGEHLVLEAYKNGFLKELVLNEKSTFSLNVPISYVNDTVNRYLSELDNPSEIIGICLKKEAKEYGNKILVLDGIQDPGNLGTIIRSAVAFDIDTIILGSKTADLYNSKTLRASQGMIFNTNIVNKDLKEEISKLINNGYKIYGTKVDGGTNIRDFKISSKYVIVMGNEGKGISEEVLNLCDEFMYISMHKQCESLNVAVATSIILYEISR